MDYEFPPVPDLRFRPLNKTIVVLEDPTVYERTKIHRVRKADGSEVLIHLIDLFDGARRVPDVRRAMVVKLPDRMAEEGVRWKAIVGTSWTPVQAMAVKDGKPHPYIAWNQELSEANRTDIAPGPGTVVWYAGAHVGLAPLTENGVEYRLIGAHQIDFYEVPDGEEGISLQSSADLAAIHTGRRVA